MDQTKSALKSVRPQWDDDVIDKLNYVWTTMILVIFSLTIAMKQYVGSPLQCWVPKEFPGFWEQYAEDYCFVENTYFVPMNHTIPATGIGRVQRELGYYQWVPIVLAVQAFLFYLPRLAWSMLNTQGYNVREIITGALEVKKDGKMQVLKGSKKNDDITKVSVYMNDALTYRKAAMGKARSASTADGSVSDIDPGYHSMHPRQHSRPGRGVWLSPLSLPQRLFGYYTTTVYMIIKMAYIANVIGQFMMMNRYLSTEYNFWGFGILNDLVHGREWHESGHFPRVTLCDFTVRKLGQLHTYTIQCVLMLNMLNEKIYLFLWWWFLLVAVMTILNFVYWLVVSFNPSSRRKFVARYLFARDLIAPPNLEGQVETFVNSDLKPDGILLLRLVSANAGDVACANLIAALWELSPYTRSKLTLKQTSTPEEGFIESPDNSYIGK